MRRAIEQTCGGYLFWINKEHCIHLLATEHNTIASSIPNTRRIATCSSRIFSSLINLLHFSSLLLPYHLHQWASWFILWGPVTHATSHANNSTWVLYTIIGIKEGSMDPLYERWWFRIDHSIKQLLANALTGTLKWAS